MVASGVAQQRPARAMFAAGKPAAVICHRPWTARTRLGRTVCQHDAMPFTLGAVIIATSINLVAGLAG